MSNDLKSTIQAKADEYYDYMVQIRRHLHKNPEVSFQEFDTTDYIVHELKKMKIETLRPLETGCLGIIKGKESNRVIAFRSDIDALEMEEEGDVKAEFLSERKGAAHCCGHDGHTANLLGTAKILTDLKDHIDGTVVLIFQPGEEKLPGGGSMLIKTGALHELGVQEIFGLHTDPKYKPGEIAVKPGPLMACTVEFKVEIFGKGGHAAAPHTAIDPIVLASQTINNFQSIVSRSVDPTEPIVITVGKVEAGSAFNVIPEKAKMMGTVRAFSMEMARFIKKRMEEVIKGTVQSAGADYDFEFTEGYPAVINDEESTDKVMQTGREILGDESVITLKRPIMAGEDFAFYQQEFPGAFFFLGTGSDESDSKWEWHHPRYNIDERALKTGSALMAGLAIGGK